MWPWMAPGTLRSPGPPQSIVYLEAGILAAAAAASSGVNCGRGAGGEASGVSIQGG